MDKQEKMIEIAGFVNSVALSWASSCLIMSNFFVKEEPDLSS